jgi:hypothetical protein
MPFCPKCGRYTEGADARFCQGCGTALVQPSTPTVVAPTTQQQKSGGGGVGVVLAIILVLIIIGAFVFFAQPHGSSNSFLQCMPHQETVYVGYINTLTQQYQFTTSNKITDVSYEQGAVLYTVHLVDDQGNHYDYHYVTGFSLTPTTITTGC